jgi:hypothetical protein
MRIKTILGLSERGVCAVEGDVADAASATATNGPAKRMTLSLNTGSHSMIRYANMLQLGPVRYVLFPRLKIGFFTLCLDVFLNIFLDSVTLVR